MKLRILLPAALAAFAPSAVTAQSSATLSWAQPGPLVGSPGMTTVFETAICTPTAGGVCGNLTESVALAFQITGQRVFAGPGGAQERTGMTFTPPQIEFVSFALIDPAKSDRVDAWIVANNPTTQRYTLFHGSSPTVKLPGELRLRFHVTVPPEAKDGDVYMLEIDDPAAAPGNMFAVDATLARHDILATNFQVAVQVRDPICDTNRDGAIGPADVTYAARATVGLEVCTFGGLAAEPGLCTVDDAVKLVQLISARNSGDTQACAG